MVIEFVKKAKFRINYEEGENRVGMVNFIAGKDGSVFINCPQKLFKTTRYFYGVMVMPPGVTSVPTYQMTESNGFVHTTKMPKISLHPDGYIHASLSSAEDSHLTRRINMGSPLGNLSCKTIVTLNWKAISKFEKNVPVKNTYHSLNLKSESPCDRFMAFMKASYDVNELLEGFQVVNHQGAEPGRIEVADEIVSGVGDGNFAIMNMPLWNKNNFRVVDESTGKIKKVEYPVWSFVFGLRDNTVRKGEMIWYLLSFFNPKDCPELDPTQPASFMFTGGMKNWEHHEIRETGEKLFVVGDQYVEADD